jgi:proteasome lid subunit RPN8/RPN11
MPAPEYLIVTEDTWRMTAVLLRGYAGQGVEAGLYWYGIRSSESAAVITVGLPRQTNRSGNFEVGADDLAVLVRRVRRPLVVVAQVHSHPGANVDHSDWDNDLVVSRKILSLVVPDYGRRVHLEDLGVHEFVDENWYRLSNDEVARRIVVTPSSVDTRT